jgi:hypothetical protein
MKLKIVYKTVNAIKNTLNTNQKQKSTKTQVYTNVYGQTERKNSYTGQMRRSLRIRHKELKKYQK